MSGFVLRQRNKRPKRNDITVLMPSSKDLELLRGLRNLLPVVENLLKYCEDGVTLRSRARTHYVEKGEKVYVYRYLEIEDYYGRVLFRAREGTPEAEEAEELVMLHNALRSICSALSTITREGEFALRQLNKLEPRFVRQPDSKTREVISGGR